MRGEEMRGIVLTSNVAKGPGDMKGPGESPAQLIWFISFEKTLQRCECKHKHFGRHKQDMRGVWGHTATFIIPDCLIITHLTCSRSKVRTYIWHLSLPPSLPPRDETYRLTCTK